MAAGTIGRGRRTAARAKGAVAWAIAAFVFLQVGLLAVTELRHPEFRDPEYGYKLELLKKLVTRLSADGKDPPMVFLALGSSRTFNGFRPDVVYERVHRAESPAIFNFGMTGAGPVTELLCLRRVLDAGIRPAGVVIEILPSLLHQVPTWTEELWFPASRIGYRDLGLLGKYSFDSKHRYREWAALQISPLYTHRFGIMSRYLRNWLPQSRHMEGWRGFDQYGWLTIDRYGSPEDHAKLLESARKEYVGAVTDFQVTEIPNRALRELIETCRREHIAAVLVVMPEAAEFRTLYPADTLTKFEAYLTKLSGELGIPFIDARSWVPDEYFMDGHHLLREGARIFTKGLSRQVIQPLLDGTPVGGKPALTR